MVKDKIGSPPPGSHPRFQDNKKGPQVLTSRIVASELRLVHDGENKVVSREEAERLSEETGLDLLIMSLDSSPPVVRLLDYGKYKYDAEKKAREAKKHQHQVEIKEIKMTVRIDEHDYQVKTNHARKFLEDDNKVKLSIRFRGREIQHPELGMKIARQFMEDLADVGTNENNPRLEGRQMVLVMGPNKKNPPPKKPKGN